jgi:hypothetical protein
VSCPVFANDIRSACCRSSNPFSNPPSSVSRDATHYSAWASAALVYLQIGVILIRQGHLGGVLHLLLVLLEHSLIDLDLGRRKGGRGNEFLGFVSFSHATNMRTIVPKSGCRQVSWRARGKASRSCSWTWPRCRSTGGSSCGGR